MGQVFSNGCDAPGIGGNPEETVNCRCVLAFRRGVDILYEISVDNPSWVLHSKIVLFGIDY